MTTTKTLKGVDEETWADFKSLAASKKMKMGRFLHYLIESHKKQSKEWWDRILNSPPILSEKEAEKMQEVVMKIRKEKWFRE